MHRGGTLPSPFSQKYKAALDRQPPKSPHDPAHFKAVTNGTSRLLQLADRNPDGKITLHDLEALLKADAKEHSSDVHIDHNHDGNVTTMDVERLMMQRDHESAALRLTVDLLQASNA